MTFLLVSFLAGILTVLAPCVLPLLPVIVGSSTTGRNRMTPYVVVGSLALSIIVFTYLLKASSAFVDVPPTFWTSLSGGILILFGVVLLFPTVWEHVPGVSRLSLSSNTLLGAGYKRHTFFGDVLMGVALGPVFSTCSPTYFVILASVLPVSFLLGTVYLLAYITGLSLILLSIALLGQRFADRIAWMSNPHGTFKRVMGGIFIVIGILIATGLEKKIETAILNTGFLDVTKVEQLLLQKAEGPMNNANATSTRYTEIVNPSGFVNTDGITIGELIGKKVVLVDFMTYSCINCQRTTPYLNAWYEKYKDQGLEIIAIHTPEFAFEKNIQNVRTAIQELGIKYPLVLDNDYATWRAYKNNFWPRKYLIDINGNVVYDHIGEGAYEETEKVIQEALKERALRMGEAAPDDSLVSPTMPAPSNRAQSPETYFGSHRNEYLGNGTQGRSGEQQFLLPFTFFQNALYLSGIWNITPEYAETVSNASVVYKFTAKNVYLVMESDTPAEVEVWQDDVLVRTVNVQSSTLYTLIENETAGSHTLELKVRTPGVRMYAFTFG